MITRISLVLTGLVLVACEHDLSELEVQELTYEQMLSQCGPTWDAQPVESYDGTLGVSTSFVDLHEGAVGYQVGTGCTGTLVSSDLFLSAGHCNYAVGQSVRFNYQDDPNGNARPTSTYSVSEVLEQQDTSSWDYAVVRLNGNPGNTWGYATMHHSDYAVGNTVSIIGHPDRRPKEIDAGPVVDYNSPVGTNWFRHAVDTVGGNSGSGVLGDNGRLVGLHTNAGCSTGNPVFGNNAMRMERLLEHSNALYSIFPGTSYCTPSEPCPDGFGDCDSNADCQAGTVCVFDVGPSYGWASWVDVCETSASSCPHAPGDYDYCRDCGPCLEGEGDCEDGECASGLVCTHDVGASYGWASNVDVCEPPTAGTKVEVRVRGAVGSERLRLQISGQTVATWNNIGTTWTTKRYDHSGSVSWNQVRIRFDNDNGSRDAYVDWVELDDVRRQAEDQATNTAFWTNGSCGGGGYSQSMHCNGYINF